MLKAVTGGGGFLGGHLVDLLLNRGHSVKVLDVLPRNPADLRTNLTWIQGDFLAKSVALDLTKGCDVLYHLASTTVPRLAHDDPEFDITSNIAGSVTLFRAAVANRVRRIVFISSGGTVYGVPQATPIPETHVTQPISAYGVGKLAIEKYLGMYHHLEGVEYCALRLSNPFGPRQRPDKAQGVVTAFISKVLRNEEVPIWGDGRVIRDYLYVEDATAAIAAAGESSFSGVVNIGSGVGISINQVIDAVERVCGVPAKRRYLPGRRFDVPANILDTRLAKRALPWECKISFDEGLRRTADALSHLV